MLDVVDGERGDRRLHDAAALLGHPERRLDVLALGDAHREDDLVGHRAPRQVADQRSGLLDRRPPSGWRRRSAPAPA